MHDQTEETETDGTQAMELQSLGARLSQLYTEYKDARREQQDEWLSDLRQYSGQYDPETLAKLQEVGARSKVYVGLTRTKVMAAYSRLVDLLLGSGSGFYGIDPTPRPQIDPAKMMAIRQQAMEEILTLAQGAPPEQQEALVAERMGELEQELKQLEEKIAEETAKEMKLDIDDILAEGNADQKIKSAMLEACIFGSGAIKSGTVTIDRVQSYQKVQDETGQTGYQLAMIESVKPDIEAVSIFDLYPDPYCTDLDNCNGLFRRHILTRRQFRELADLSGFDGDMIRHLIDTNRTGNHSEETHERTRRQIAGISDHGESNRFEVLEYWGTGDGYDLTDHNIEMEEGTDLSADFDANIWLCGGKVIKAALNPIRGYRIPYHVFPYERSPHQFWGVGVPRMMRDSQSTMNAATRIWLDNMAMSSAPMVEVNTDLLEAGEDPTDLHPWRVFLRSGGDGSMPAVRYYQPIANANGLNQIVEIFRRFADETTSLPSYTHGQQTSSLNKTATGMSMLMGAANVALKSTIKNIDDFLISPMIESIYHFQMQFGLNENAKGDLKINARGSTALIQKEVQSQRLLQLLSLLNNPMDQAIVNRPQLLRDIAVSMDIDPDDFIKSEEQIRAEQEALLQQQMLAQASAGGGAPSGEPGMAAPQGPV